MSDERPVVCDTTPLIMLAGVGLLDLLPQLYGTILVADSVVREFDAKRAAGDPDLSDVAWMTIRPVSPAPDLLDQLDAGEAATIALAEAMNARLVLLDERRGRWIARQRGLAVAGTGAVLLAGKTAGLIPAIAPPLRQMIAQGRYLSPHLLTALLAAANETLEDL